MRQMTPFPFRTATASGRILYRLNECGLLVVQGITPPFPARFGTYWAGVTNGNEWALRTPGDPSTMLRIVDAYGDFVRSSSDKWKVDERVIFTSIGCESGGNPRAQRAEPGYPDYPAYDPKLVNSILSPARDAQNIADPKWKGSRASYGLTQILLSTANAVQPALFAGVSPEAWREVLFDPAKNIDIAAKLYAGDGLKTAGLDPIAIRFQAGAGSDSKTPNGVHIGSSEEARATRNPDFEHGWGAESYSEEIVIRFLGFWNDLQAVQGGGAACIPFTFGIFNFAFALCAFAAFHVLA